jgi:hypothetical protein
MRFIGDLCPLVAKYSKFKFFGILYGFYSLKLIVLVHQLINVMPNPIFFKGFHKATSIVYQDVND